MHNYPVAFKITIFFLRGGIDNQRLDHSKTKQHPRGVKLTSIGLYSQKILLGFPSVGGFLYGTAVNAS